MEARAANRSAGTLAAIGLLLAWSLFGLLAADASAAVPSRAAVTQYEMPRVPPTGGTGPLAVDRLGNVWFEQTYEVPSEGPGDPPNFPGRVVRMNRQGEVAVGAERRPSGLAAGPDGSVWFTGFREIGRIAPDGSVTTFPVPYGENEEEKFVFMDGPLVVGADGNVWFSGARGIRKQDGSLVGDEPIIGRLTPAGELSEFDLPTGDGHPIRLALGPDGAVWFTGSARGGVGRVTPTGQVQMLVPAGSAWTYGIASGPDGAVWFLKEQAGGGGAAIARVTTLGAVTEYPLEPAQRSEEPGGLLGGGAIAAGPDGRMWFSLEPGLMGRIGPTGLISEVPVPTRGPETIVSGPEGSLWYSSAAHPPCLPGDSVCGDGGYYQSGVIARVDPAPLSVDIESGKLIAKARQVKVRLLCIDGAATQACKGRLLLRAGKGAGKRRYSLGVDRSRAIKVRLNRRTRKKLLRTGRLRLRITATLAGGRKSTQVVRLRVRRR